MIKKKKKYPSDKMWGANKAFGTPEFVIEVRPMPFKFSGKTTVNNGAATTLIEKIPHKRRRFLPF